MSGAAQDEGRYSRIFLPVAYAASDRVKQQGTRFVYYTTAHTAFLILREREIWMRNTMTMNDFMEVEHGIECLREVYRSAPGRAFEAAVDQCFPGLADEVRQLFNAWIPSIRRDTFVACVSEHLPDEDNHGRLSMWRAYGGKAGVALVMNSDAILAESDALAAYSSPVSYMEASELGAEMERIAATVSVNRDFVQSFGRDRLKTAAFHLLRFAAVCTKHPGFKEEREWRVVASPTFEPSDLVPSELEVVKGIPQTVLKIKLRNYPERGLSGLEPRELLHRVIVGPCEYPDVVRRAIYHLLVDVGVSQPESRIAVSRIPLRWDS